MRASKETLLKAIDNERRKLASAGKTIVELRQRAEDKTRSSCARTYAVEYYEEVRLAIKKMERLLEGMQ